ncbi:MAG: hypothetical protein RJA61_3 [Candidatus Parcubacteria bacterium]|jgi:uncharacterized UPF0160 family protein
MNKSVLKVVTHNGRFHADDCFSVATLKLVLGEIELIRTRDPEIIVQGDIVLDIGGIYNEGLGRFDHHQKEGAGFRENGIPYASFGLIWKKYGNALCQSEEIASYIDKTLVAPIDAIDNGVALMTPLREDVLPVLIQQIMSLYSPAWNEQDRTYDQGFDEMVLYAQKILERAIVHAKAYVQAEALVEGVYKNSSDKQIIVLEDRYPYLVLQAHPEVLFVVLPSSEGDNWKVDAVPQLKESFSPRKKFPESWAGKRDKELQDITGVPDAVFCHKALFMAVAGSKEGALKLADLALKN